METVRGVFYRIIFFGPFVAVTNAYLSILVGEAYTAVTRSGKLCNDKAKGIWFLSNEILTIVKDDVD